MRLGVILSDLDHTPPPRTFELDLPPNARVLITGPSGSGKTRLLHALEHALQDRAVRVLHPTARLPAHRSILDAVLDSPRADPRPARADPDRLDRALALLASVGLCEASILARRVGELSAGQLERLRVAHALKRADHARATPGTGVAARGTAPVPRALLLDEFGATLDDDTLRALTRLLRRAARSRPGLTLIIATHRPAIVADALHPTHRIVLSDAAAPTVHASPEPSQAEPPSCSDALAAPPAATPIAWPTASLRALRHPGGSALNANEQPEIIEGTPDDLAALAHHHYRLRPPATIDRVFVAVDPLTRARIAVLTLSRPTLNASWRRSAWPHRYSTPDKRLNARRLNEELRAVSRVIVAPHHRAMGVARALLAHALAHADVPHIESLVAMGGAVGVFRAAGMTEYPVPVSACDARLLDLLSHLNVEPWRLATPRDTLARLSATPTTRALLEHELRRWALSSRATRASAANPRPAPGAARAHADPLEPLFTKACRRLARTPRAFAWSRPPEEASPGMSAPA